MMVVPHSWRCESGYPQRLDLSMGMHCRLGKYTLSHVTRRLGWVISDFIFTLIFLIEFLLKFGGMGLKYFKDGASTARASLCVCRASGLVGISKCM